MTTAVRLRGRTVEPRPGRPLVMGIVNASPESFSDGAAVGGPDVQVERARQLVEEGADLIDVGGESGVTDRPPVSAEEETARVVPVVERLAAEGVAVSIDTWKVDVARAALEAGAVLVNDPSGLSDPGVADACAAAGAGLVVTHTRAAPKEKEFPDYEDVVADVVGYLRERVAVAVERGVAEDSIVVDPGPDLAKTPAETVEVIRRLDEVVALGHPVLLAVSRKDFVGSLTGRPPPDRLAGTLAAIGVGVDAGAALVRVHDVASVVDYLAVRIALRGESDAVPDLPLDSRLRRERQAH